MSDNTNTSPFPWKVLSPSSGWKQRIILAYGPSGAGKTYFAAQFPDPLLLSCDPGMLGGALSAEKFNVKHMKVTSYQELLNLLPKLKANAGTEFQTLVIDSISYLGKMTMKAILANVGREIPRFEEYNLNYTRMARLIENLTEMNCHVIFTAVDKMDKDEVTGKMMGGPALVGQLQKELPQAVDICVRLFTQTGYDNTGKLKVTYKFRTVPDDLWFAKDRTQKIAKEGETTFDAFKDLFNFGEKA